MNIKRTLAAAALAALAMTMTACGSDAPAPLVPVETATATPTTEPTPSETADPTVSEALVHNAEATDTAAAAEFGEQVDADVQKFASLWTSTAVVNQALAAGDITRDKAAKSLSMDDSLRNAKAADMVLQPMPNPAKVGDVYVKAVDVSSVRYGVKESAQGTGKPAVLGLTWQATVRVYFKDHGKTLQGDVTVEFRIDAIRTPNEGGWPLTATAVSTERVNYTQPVAVVSGE